MINISEFSVKSFEIAWFGREFRLLLTFYNVVGVFKWVSEPSISVK